MSDAPPETTHAKSNGGWFGRKKLVVGEIYEAWGVDRESFPLPLCLRYEGRDNWWSRRRFTLTSPFRYQERWSTGSVEMEVPAGLPTDLASIPWFVAWIISPEDPAVAIPAVWHDYAYRDLHSRGRFLLDANFRAMMDANDAPRWIEYLVYFTVRATGWLVYNRRKGENVDSLEATQTGDLDD